MSYRFLFLLQYLTDSASIGEFPIWFMFNPYLVPLAPVVSLIIHIVCFFITFLGRHFIPGTLIIIILFGSILVVVILFGMFGFGFLAT